MSIQRWILALGILSLAGMKSVAEPLEIGARIPAIEARDQSNQPVQLDEAGKTGYTLIYFYPKADTPGCTAQACSLRDDYEKLQAKGVRVFGVSVDGPEAQSKFREKYKLPFQLIADPEGKVVEAFGVPRGALGFASRQAFLFKDGVLVWRDLKASTKEQAADVLRVISDSAS
jgi:peroxiredoxin Q/BCP